MTLDAVWMRALLAAGLVAVALLGASLPTHALPSTVVVLVPSALILVLAVRRRPGPAEESPRMRRGVLLWSLLALAGLAWEAYAFVRQPDWSRADPANPTLSTLLDPVLEQGPLRIAGWLLWLWAGWRLVTR